MTSVELNEIVVESQNAFDGAEYAPEDILRGLSVREQCLGNIYMSGKQATEQHMAMAQSAGMDVTEEERLLAVGNAAFALGYRLHRTDRHTRGLSVSIPSEALAWRLVTAGYIATTEQVRIEYVVLK